MAKTFEAYTQASERPVRTFSHRDMAERFKAELEAAGSAVTIKQVRMQRRAA